MNLFSTINARINSFRNIPNSVVTLYDRVKNFLPLNPKIIEAGAHMGYDTVGLSKLWPKGTIYAFEPIPFLYHELVQRIKHYSNVKPYELALGETDGIVSMYVSSGKSNASSSILKPSKHIELFPEVTFKDTISVSMESLSTWAAKESATKIDLMWLDMQGYETNALKGAGELLKNVNVIYTELCTDELYQGLTTRDDYLKFLSNSGFDLFSIFDEDNNISDGIFLNRKLGRT